MTMLLPGAEHLDLTGPLAHLAEHGYARLGRVLDDAGLLALRERAEDLMLGRVTYPGLFFQLDAETGRYEDAPIGLGWQGPSLAYRKLEKLEKDPRFLAWLENPLFEKVTRAQIEGPVVLYRAIVFNKGIPGGSDIPWHQDGGKLWGLSQDPFVQIWTALDDAPIDGGCLEVIPGSHVGGLVTPLGGVVPADKVAAARANERAVPLPAAAGEVVLVHNNLWHRSGRSRTGKRRLALSVCYMSAATRCLRKKRAPRVFFPVFSPR
ncbi:MAG: phytanoyl-CoA dioxygenase [Myxococcaceae bacterium]|nr:phytanoyl-CoA dioxygenase [Myxococcaceae bacterium]